MMSSGGVNFGGFTEIEGKTVATGMIPGFNLKDMIKSMTEAKKVPIKALEEDIKVNNKKLEALNQFKTYVTNFQEASENLRNIYNFLDTDDAFSARKIALKANGTTSSAESFLNATATNNAQTSTYIVTVGQIAKSKIRTSQSFTSASTSVVAASSTANMFTAGTFQINGVNITLNTGDTLADVAAAINSETDNTKTQATLLQVASNNFQLILQSTETGLANAFTLNDPSSVLTNITFANTQDALDASVTINGTTITRSTNVISDAINNVNFNISQATPVGASITVNVKPDTEAIMSAIDDFIVAYNDLTLFSSKQQERDLNYQFKDTAILGNDTTLKYTMDAVMTEITNSVRGLATGPYTLGEIGLNLVNFGGDDKFPYTRNIIEADKTVLKNILASNYNAVKNVFGFVFDANSPSVMVNSTSNNFSIYNFSLAINTAAPTNKVVANYTDSLGVAQSLTLNYSGGANSGIITAPANSVFDGLEMVYSGTGSQTVTVKITQGIADRLHNFLTDSILGTNGLIQDEIDLIAKDNQRYQEEINKKNDDLKEYTNNLIERFGAAGQAIAKLNTTIMFLQAQSNYYLANNK